MSLATTIIAAGDDSYLTATSYIASGHYGHAEVLLLELCTRHTRKAAGSSVSISDALRALIALGDLYRAQFRWANAAGKYNQALALWERASWFADNDSAIHPTAFVPSLVECLEKLGGDGAKLAPLLRLKTLKLAGQCSTC